MRSEQPGSKPLDIPEQVPNPAHAPRREPAPEKPVPSKPVRVPERVSHEKPRHLAGFFSSFRSSVNTKSPAHARLFNYSELFKSRDQNRSESKTAQKGYNGGSPIPILTILWRANLALKIVNRATTRIEPYDICRHDRYP